MTPEQLLLAVMGPVMLAGGAAALALAWVVHRDPGLPVTPEWDRTVLDAPEPPARAAGAHRAEHWQPQARAHELIAATSTSYTPRHGFAEVPPSIITLAYLRRAGAEDVAEILGLTGGPPAGPQLRRQPGCTRPAQTRDGHCKPCYGRAYRQRRLAEGRFSHGTSTGYVLGCRCLECLAADSRRRGRGGVR